MAGAIPNILPASSLNQRGRSRSDEAEIVAALRERCRRPRQCRSGFECFRVITVRGKVGRAFMLVGRTENRGSVNFTGCLRSTGAPSYSEAVAIKNISVHGARVVTPRPLQVHSRVLLTASIGDFRVDAEVVYCERLGDDRCAVGLRFPNGVDRE